MDTVDTFIGGVVNTVLKSTTSSFPDAIITVRDLFENQLETAVEATRTHIKYLLDTERDCLYARNNEYDNKMVDRTMERLGIDGDNSNDNILREALQKVRQLLVGRLRTATKINLVLDLRHRPVGVVAALHEALQKVKESFTDSRHADEERLFDSVQVYVEHAGTRLMDSVPMIIRRELMLDIWNRFDQLMRDLRDGEKPEIFISDERISHIMKEPVGITAKRDRLRQQKKILQGSQREILRVM